MSDGVVIDGDGSTATITRPSGFLQGSFSPDGSTVAFLGRDGSLDSATADGTGKPSVIAPPAVGGYYSPAWSPTVSEIAFIAMGKPATISALSPDGTGRHVIVRLRGRVGEPGPLVWSPDGSMLAFAQNPTCCGTGQTAIWTVNADGSDLHRITPSDGSWGPTWSPDGQRIAFVRGPHVFTVARDGTDPQRVSAGPVYGYFIAWNPAPSSSSPAVGTASTVFEKRTTVAQPLVSSRGDGKQRLMAVCVGHVLPCTWIPNA
jgi:Tol biopolymer transport system component